MRGTFCPLISLYVYVMHVYVICMLCNVYVMFMYDMSSDFKKISNRFKFEMF